MDKYNITVETRKKRLFKNNGWYLTTPFHAQNVAPARFNMGWPIWAKDKDCSVPTTIVDGGVAIHQPASNI